MTSFRERFRTAVREGLARAGESPLVTEADLEFLPAPVARHLRRCGAVGRPRVRNLRARFTGEFRNGLDGSWMNIQAEQYDFFDSPARYFLMRGSRFGLPIQALHLFRGPGTSFQVKLAGLFQLVDAVGPELEQSETVTFFNDLCLLAPAALIDRHRIVWEEAGPRAARARFTHQGRTISALLSFNQAGDLAGFESADRYLSADGRTFKSVPWSTPMQDYRDFGGRRAPAYAEAVWHLTGGEYCYGRFRLAGIEYNVRNIKD